MAAAAAAVAKNKVADSFVRPSVPYRCNSRHWLLAAFLQYYALIQHAAPYCCGTELDFGQTWLVYSARGTVVLVRLILQCNVLSSSSSSLVAVSNAATRRLCKEEEKRCITVLCSACVPAAACM
jgi:hypothetical protein